MELNGYIKLFRKLVKWRWYQDSVVKDLFLHCLIFASFRDFNWMDQMLKAGQFVTSYKNLSQELGFSVQQIRTALKKLESTGEITSKSTNKFTVITVVNWANYQSDEDYINTESNNPTTNEQQTDNKRTTNEQQHRKNIKNIKNIKNSEKRARAYPLLSQISEFIKVNNLNVDAEKFFKHYSERDWLTADGKPIDDWQSVVRSWSKKEMKPTPTYPNGYSNVRRLTDE